MISINTSWNIFHFRAALISALQRAGHTIITAAPADAYTERLRALVDAHYTLPMDNAGTSPLRDAMLGWRYGCLLRRVRPAALLTYTIKPNIYGALAARMLGIPVIANVSGLGTAFIRITWVTRVAMLLYRLAFARVACVFFQNAEDRDMFVRHRLVAPEKAKLVPGSGIDLAYFTPPPARDDGAPLAFALIARMVRDKGIGEFVEAARRVKALHPHVIFRLIGPIHIQNQTAIDAHTIAGWVAEGIIEYPGETDDVRSAIAAQDCIVLPSYREGLSRVLLEAAAMGKPLIATDVPGCRQVVTHMENGLLCAPQDAASLAAALLAFIALPAETRRRMGQASRQKAEQEFDEAHVFAAYERELSALIMGAAAPLADAHTS
jgi:glycosyltransferase involved in cell wall biosynthesis